MAWSWRRRWEQGRHQLGGRGGPVRTLPRSRGGEHPARGLEVFAELGYDRASAREPARRPGVSHNVINDRYGSKAAFWRAVVDAVLGAQLARVPHGDPSLDDAERLRQIVSGFYRTAVDTPLIGRLFVDELSRSRRSRAP